MKNLILGILTSSLLFVGCTAKDDSAQIDNQDSTQQESVQQEPGQVDTPTESDDQIIEQAASPLDYTIFNEATESLDLNKCKDISEEGLQAECKQVIDSNLLSIEAFESLDKSKCDDIVLEGYKESCITNIKNEIESQEQVKLDDEKDKALIKLNEEVSKKAMNSSDYTLCDQIGDINLVDSCKLNVIMALMVEEKNPDLCNALKVDPFKTTCLEEAAKN